MTLPITANREWLEILTNIKYMGSRYTVREQATTEFVNYHSAFDMKFPVVSIPERRMGEHFLPAEAHWILTGSNKVSGIRDYSAMIAKFSDDEVHFNGAYGPKILEQMPYVVDCLASDKATRQAVMTIWRENPRPSKDIPCTVALQFLIRHNQLHCLATMRSSDVWLGWVYDSFNFTMITTYVQLLLQLRGISLGLGRLAINAGSQHYYDRNEKAVEEILDKYVNVEGNVCNVKNLETIPHFRVPDATSFQNTDEFLAWLSHAKTVGIGQADGVYTEEIYYEQT